MLYITNAAFGKEGLNTHVMSWVMAISLSNFLDRDFYFDFEIPCSTPPDYATRPEMKEKFGALLTNKRSLVSDLMEIPNRRVREIDRDVEKLELQLMPGYFATTEEVKTRYEGSFLWNSFGLGRTALTREYLNSFPLVEWTRTQLSSPALFYLLPKDEKRKLLSSAELNYRRDIEDLAAHIIDDWGEYNAIHLRLGDFLTHYAEDEYSVNLERFAKYVDATFPDRDTRILVATDGLHEKDLFKQLLKYRRYNFIDEVIFEFYPTSYGRMEFTDFNSVTILNELVCAAAEKFIGTYRSTFTGLIHRLRQERYGKRDFCYFPDDKVLRLVGEDMVMRPDRTGFFDWNRYSVFSEDHSQMSWMREWDHENTLVDI